MHPRKRVKKVEKIHIPNKLFYKYVNFLSSTEIYFPAFLLLHFPNDLINKLNIAEL